MNLLIRKQAANTISSTAAWVDSMNTDGAGGRWLDKLLETLYHAAHMGIKYALCQNESLTKRGYHCFTYNDKWVVAYKIVGDNFIVYRFILGAKLK
jgi:hypothetical protein